MATHALDAARPARPRLSLGAWWRDHQRRVMASSIERALEQAARPRGFSAAVPVRSEALAARDELEALAVQLRETPDPSPRALALSRALILDGTSPLFNAEAAGTLRGAVREALHAFDSTGDETYPPTV